MILAAQNQEERHTLLTYLASRIGETPRSLVGDMPYAALGIIRDERILGAIVFLNYRRESVEFHLCGSPGWLTRGEIKALFAYPFVTLNCLRLWCMVRRNNKPARRGAERLGFKILGVAEDEFGEGKDGVISTMSRANCKWIKNHG
jgi:RimJ/RimL family protein N-acetyltransferase